MTKIIGAYKAPNKQHGFDFVWEGDIRFGPSFYKIVLDGWTIPNRIFGFEFLWHPESRYLALQEWLTADYREGPITALTIIDVEQRNIAMISKAEKGFVQPNKFEDNSIIFEKNYVGLEKIVECEIDINEIRNWESLILS